MSGLDLKADSPEELVRAWDADEIIPTVELGGIGPGYEQTIFAPVEGLSVASWCPTSDGSGQPEQVHVVLSLGESATIVVRFKSTRSLDEFIAALVAHRDEVWP